MTPRGTTAQYGPLSFEWLGYATVRIDNDSVVYIDPGRYGVLKGMEPHDGDLVLVSHDHHYDPDAIHRMTKEDAVVVAHADLDTSVLDREVIDIRVGDEIEVEGVKVRGVPSYNLREGKHVRENGEPYHKEGDVVGFYLETEGVSVYFPSDSDPLEENAELDVDVFIPPIGGSFTMDAREAAEFAEILEPELVLPVHYDTFEAIEANEEMFKKDCKSRNLNVVLV